MNVGSILALVPKGLVVIGAKEDAVVFRRISYLMSKCSVISFINCSYEMRTLFGEGKYIYFLVTVISYLSY